MDIFTWKIGGLGALGIIALLVIVRLFRNGLGTYSQSREAMQARIEKTNAEIRECNQAIPEQEQTFLLEASVREMLELAGVAECCTVEREAHGVRLCTPGGEWVLRYRPKRTMLRGVRRTLYGAGTWEACPQLRQGEGVCDDPAREAHTFTELGDFVGYLDTLVRQETSYAVESAAAEALPRFRQRGR